MKPTFYPDPASRRAARIGVFYGLAAYALWGIFPIYFWAITQTGVAATEILAHRICWSCLLLMLLVTAQRRWQPLLDALRHPRTLALLAASTLLIATNWLTFLHAIETRQTLQSSLGYFLTPLANVLLGVTVLGERLRVLQIISVVLAAVGVAVQAYSAGGIPWIALLLAVSFAFYGLCRKTVAVDSLLGLAIETMLLAPLALAYLVWLTMTNQAHAATPWAWSLLIFSGVATAIPLLLFASSARRLRFVTIGFLQYLGPTLQFIVAVYVFGEPLSPLALISFGLIWLAILVYCCDTLWALRQPQTRPLADPPLPLEDL